MQVFKREENLNCGYMCRLQQSAPIVPPASAERLGEKAFDVFTEG